MTEAKIYADYLKKNKENAKVAVLYQNDGFGKDLLGGFEKAIEGSGVKIVAKESYEVTDPTITSQIRKLAGSGADTFLNITTPKFSALAIATIAKRDWKPLHILNNVGASKTLVLTPGRARERQGHRLGDLLQGPGLTGLGRRRGDEGVQGQHEEVRAPRGPERVLLRLRLGRRGDDGRGAQEHEGADARRR